MQAAKAIASICLAMSLSACASTQLNFNTLDVAGSIESLYTRQVLNNLSTFASAPNGLPSQIDIQSGTVQTSNAITPNISFPLTGSSTRGFSGTVAALTGSGSRTFAGAGSGMTASDGWQQNWNITPLTDANTLRNLRALYRYAVYSSDIRREYHVPRTKQGRNYSADPFMLLEPQCVLCGKEQRVNSRLAGGWLYWLNDNGIEFSRLPADVDKSDLVELGHYGSNQLFMKRSDYQRGVLSDFVLFVLPITEPSGSDPSKPGVAPGSRVGASANRPNFAPVPLGIQPPGP